MRRLVAFALIAGLTIAAALTFRHWMPLPVQEEMSACVTGISEIPSQSRSQSF